MKGPRVGRGTPAAPVQELGDAFLFDALMRLAPDQIYFKDLQSRFVRISAVMAPRFSVPEDEIIGKTDAEFLALEIAEEFRAQEREIMEGGAPMVDVEQEGAMEDGRVGWNSTTKLPLVAPDGTVVGLLGLNRDITARKEAELAVERQQARMAAVVRAQAEVATTEDGLEHALQLTVAHARELTDLQGAVALIENAPGTHELHAGLFGKIPQAARDRCIARGEPYLADGVAAVPVRHDGAVVGLLAIRARPGAELEDADVEALGLLAVVVSAAVGRDALRRSAEASEYQALHDGLTGLPNRILFNDRIEQTLHAAQREGERVAILLMDLDRFKEINDTLGHAAGDHVLKEVARRLAERLRASDTVARLGGDEFGLVLPKQAVDEDLVHLLESLSAAVAEPIEVEGLPLAVESSIGVAFFPDHGDTPGDLVKRADVAMYAAKQGNRPFAFYEHSDGAEDALRLTLLAELRTALERGELVMYYQPKIVVADGGVRGLEALVRWNHPTRGLIPPAQFIPIAEETGLIKPLTQYVIESVVAQLAAWRARGLEFSVAVNVTTRNLIDVHFPDDVAAVLSRHEIPASQLEFELTESTMLEDPSRTKAIMERLHAMGVRLSVDDFGTGYSSLTYLRELPIDEVKVDRSFVIEMLADPHNATIVRSTIDLARNLGLDVVAEGVESPEVLEQLREMHCGLAQGFLFARPMPAADVEAWAQARPTSLATS